MSAATPPPPVRRLLLPVICGLLLTLAMVRMPVPMGVDPLSAHRAQLYETLRLGRNWAELTTTEGPLAALQTPAYVSGSIWMALSWQILGNMLLAGVLITAAWRLPWSRRAWALGCLAGVLARWPELAPWLVIVVLGHDLILTWDREPAVVLPAAATMGFIALFSVGHLLLAVCAVGFTVFTARPPRAKFFAAAGLVLGVTGGWLLLGQSPPALLLWLGRELPALWSTAPAFRHIAITPFTTWACLGALGFATVLLRHHRTVSARQRSLPGGLFLAIAVWFAWKTIALQAYGLPPVFFGTLLLAGFLFWHHGCRTRWVAALLALGLTGLARGHPDFLPDVLGHFNRQMVFNSRQLSRGPQFRTDLREQVAALRLAHQWPELQAIIGRAPVGADGDTLARAMLNNLAVVYPAGTRTGPNAPAFVVQSLSASIQQPPAFANAKADLALYRNYELKTEKADILLWRHRAAETAAPVQVAAGSLRFGEPLKLPVAPDTAYWLELDMRPGLLGHAWSLIDELTAPSLIAHVEADATMRYALPPAVAARGFLIDPLIRGNVEFQNWQRGGRPARTTEVMIVLPPAGAWLWPARFDYRLHAIPGLKLTSEALRDTPGVVFRAFNRRPVGSAYSLPFVESTTGPNDAAFFVHPDSLLEFAVHGTDRRIRGSFGIAAGAYDRPDKTDGVDFAIEFLGLDGDRHTLLHRYLNPRVEAADHAKQEFDLVLPDATDGRLFLRTFNPPYRGSAWDWAYWQNVVIE